MKLSRTEIDRIKQRIAKAERRVAAGYVAKGESEKDRAVRLTAILKSQEN